jgi:hypothetical protein
MIIKLIYLSIIIIITIFIYSLYWISNQDYKREIDKIEVLEKINKDNELKQDLARNNSLKCVYGDYDNPRSCYLKSNKKCTWNIFGNRSDMKNN